MLTLIAYLIIALLFTARLSCELAAQDYRRNEINYARLYLVSLAWPLLCLSMLFIVVDDRTPEVKSP